MASLPLHSFSYIVGLDMKSLDYDSRKSLKAYLDGRGLAMQKRFGQNFLTNSRARQKILSLLGDLRGKRVWEIGPGLGNLSHSILPLAASLRVFEIDHGFAEALGDLFGDEGAFSLVEGDFLKTWRQSLARETPDLVCGNLPYNAAGAFLADFAESGFRPRLMVFTVQKEGAERLRAKPGDKDYSSFGVLCQSCYRIDWEMDLAPASFWPSPDVQSSVVSLRPREDFPPLADREGFLSLVRASFRSRRKTLRNNLLAANYPLDAILSAMAALGLDQNIRAERLSPEDFAALSQGLGRP